MPLTQLEPTSALILIDLQKGIVDSVRPEVDSVLSNAAALADAFSAHGRARERRRRHARTYRCAGRRGVTQVVIGGVSTSIGVETTARSAYELGYHVVLAIDTMLDGTAA